MKKMKIFARFMCMFSFIIMVLVYHFGDNIKLLVYTGTCAILLYLVQRDL